MPNSQKLNQQEPIFKSEHFNIPFDGFSVDLFLRDCVDGIQERVDHKSVDVVITSPPYNIGVNYNSYDDSISREDYISWLGRWAKVVKRAMKDSGSLFINIGSKPSEPWVPFEVIAEMRKYFKLQNVIHWIKSIYIKNGSYGEKVELNVGHFKPINSKRFLNDTHEYVFHLTKKGNVELDRLAVGVPYKDDSNINRWEKGKDGIRCRGNSWYIPYKTIQSKVRDRPHPASFPAVVAEMCILLHGLENLELVMDPFMGIGNTGIACKHLGKNCVGFEIDPEYFRESQRLIEGDLFV